MHVATEGPLGLTGRRYALRRGMPLVSSFHTNFPQYSRHYGAALFEPLVWRWLRWFHRPARLTLTPGEAVRDELARRGIGRPVVWGRGVDSAHSRPPPSSSANAATDPSAVFREGLARGGTIFQHLEGCWHGDGSIFFNATSGGDAGAGQVWQYRPRGDAGGQLILVFESPSPDVLDSPDNIVVTPRGGLILCEDGDDEQYLRGLTQRGEIFDFALNTDNDTEFAGACFSPDGQYLFVNIFGDSSKPYSSFGKTFAIWGPWEDGAL